MITSFIHFLHVKPNIVVESYDNNFSHSSCGFFDMMRVSSHAIARDNHMIRNDMILVTAFSATLPPRRRACAIFDTTCLPVKKCALLFFAQVELYPIIHARAHFLWHLTGIKHLLVRIG